ncbi:MAG: dihydrodipicolinate synthase family protein [Salibacteraceae bacterium]|nr:dihydrodipicolinate synthase family protein [Salibacteraceae bacterium]
MNTERINKILGPVIPLPLPFNEDETVAYDALHSYVDFLVNNGIKNVMTTVGTSRFNLLTFDEIKKVNETVVKAANGRAKTIVANPAQGGTIHAIEFAKHAQEIGADFFLVCFPERDYGDEHTLPFFQRLHDATCIDILIHEMPRRNGLGLGSKQYGVELLEKLFAMKRIIGLKEEALDAEYSNMLVERFSKEAIIIGAGGGMSRYLYRDFERGSKAFLGGLGNFKPSIEIEFYDAITSGNRDRAAVIVEDIELKYFEQVVPIGWHPHLKAALAIKGLMPNWERSPMKNLSSEEVSTIAKAFKANNWL